jgi:threonylcarbamoyladenosine tRNA methylthiotransferase MtaB
MKPKVKGNIKTKNAKRLRLLNKRLMYEYNSQYIGKTKKIIVENNKDQKTGLYTGYTDNYIKVLVDAKPEDIEKIKKVKITRCNSYDTVIGNILKKEDFNG